MLASRYKAVWGIESGSREATTVPVDGGEVLASRYKAVWGIGSGSREATGDDDYDSMASDTGDDGPVDRSRSRRTQTDCRSSDDFEVPRDVLANRYKVVYGLASPPRLERAEGGLQPDLID